MAQRDQGSSPWAHSKKEQIMGVWDVIKGRRKAADKAGRDTDAPPEKDPHDDESHGMEPCYHIDPVTKQPKHPGGHKK